MLNAYAVGQCVIVLICLILTKSVDAKPYLSTDTADQWAETPYGLVPLSDIIAVDQDETVKILPDRHVAKVIRLTGAIVKDYGVKPQDGLEQVDPYEYAAKRRMAYLQAKPASHPNTAEAFYANYPGHTAGAGIKHVKSFSTTWIVPSKPEKTASKRTYFMWNGLARGALQPVLQWGRGTAHYAIANWAFVGGKYVHGKYIEVDPGIQLTGNISLESHDENGWEYKESFLGYSRADLYVPRQSEANDVMECFEAYTQNLSEWPANLYTSMDHISLSLWQGTLPTKLNWYVRGRFIPTPSGNNTVIVKKSPNDGRIDFYFH